ncbi:acyl-phosphate glycerol 3-phosphate acyltransferase [Pokkaliibacter plantistimulans]|uniref:Acyl-phosphate glycerol 3-phosphate acyltransferase n=1 Tax=Pokkaliibacter plantistimulans TaxID=1635171 RepID=A0ABX5LU28_9GAMM|nr:lysophospholipid acyltransferase family protein [Pokkaliibacter plantistimulans]PXF30175.1 acyl-phosphate glycerol 3-phosphate acyltransferase [Pokkaliibacter plantistimulans]
MAALIAGLRTCIFYLGYFPTVISYSLICVVFFVWVPYRLRHPLVVLFNRFFLWWLRISCGVRYQVTGMEHLPRDGAFVLISNHQSQWETFYLQTLPRALVTVLKKELLSVPFFGWALRLLRPIAIDRSQKANALKQILKQGKERLGAGEGLLIFPQGTRLDPGVEGTYSKSGTVLACSSGVPLLPLVHNAGTCWPNKRFIKFPGTIQIVLGAPIDTVGKTTDEVHSQAVDWMQAQLKAMPQHLPG